MRQRSPMGRLLNKRIVTDFREPFNEGVPKFAIKGLSIVTLPFQTTANASMQIMSGNIYRKLLMIQNLDLATNVFVNFGKEAGATTGFLLLPTGSILFQNDGRVPLDSIYVFATAAVNLFTLQGSGY